MPGPMSDKKALRQKLRRWRCIKEKSGKQSADNILKMLEKVSGCWLKQFFIFIDLVMEANITFDA